MLCLLALVHCGVYLPLHHSLGQGREQKSTPIASGLGTQAMECILQMWLHCAHLNERLVEVLAIACSLTNARCSRNCTMCALLKVHV